MIIIRPIQDSDSEAFIDFVFQSTLGMRSLPKNRDRLLQKIANSQLSFSKNTSAPTQEIYLFILEDLSSKQIIGTSAIWTTKGTLSTDLFYRLETIPFSCPWQEAPKELKILKVVSPKEDITKIGSLYLHPSFQHHGLGSLLSLSRFLFMAGHPHLFFPTVIAELRGVIQKNQTSPFWNGLGRHFCNISFPELMSRLDQYKSIIPTLLPSHPIYVSLLSLDAQEAIGAVHESTIGALKMLTHEGFTSTRDIDLFDGGPKVSAKLPHIHTIKQSTTTTLGKISSDSLEGNLYIIANESLSFRACYGKIYIESSGEAVLTKEVAEALNLTVGAPFRYTSIGGIR